MRRAMLVHAASVPADVYPRLVEQLARDGPVHVVRAFADWSRPDVDGWLPVLRRHGVAMRHHFRTRDTHDPALVALTVEALTLAATADLDHLVLVGDVGAATPLVERLQELGVLVTGVGPSRTPHEFRSACDDFWSLGDFVATSGHHDPGRHRA